MYCCQERQHQRYGKMFREKWGTKWQVHVSDPQLIEKVYRHEGRYPHRPCIQSWLLYRRLVDKPNGLFTSWVSNEQLAFCRLHIDFSIINRERIRLRLVNKQKDTVASTPCGTEARAPHFYKWLGTGSTGAPWVEQEQTRNWPNRILTIMKALTKTTNCTCRAKTSGGARQNFFPAFRAGYVPPLLNSFWRHWTDNNQLSGFSIVITIIRPII